MQTYRNTGANCSLYCIRDIFGSLTIADPALFNLAGGGLREGLAVSPGRYGYKSGSSINYYAQAAFVHCAGRRHGLINAWQKHAVANAENIQF